MLGVAIKEEREQAAWSEGVAIWVAVLVVSLVASGNDYQKDMQFRKLNAQKEVVEIKAGGGRSEGVGGGGWNGVVGRGEEGGRAGGARSPPGRPSNAAHARHAPLSPEQTVRGGVEQLVVNSDLVAGDVVKLITGDKVAADGILLHAQGLVIDEASLTGESDPIKKTVEGAPWIRCGTQASWAGGWVCGRAGRG